MNGPIVVVLAWPRILIYSNLYIDISNVSILWLVIFYYIDTIHLEIQRPGHPSHLSVELLRDICAPFKPHLFCVVHLPHVRSRVRSHV